MSIYYFDTQRRVYKKQFSSRAVIKKKVYCCTVPSSMVQMLLDNDTDNTTIFEKDGWG
jgi:hypothetical protein